MRSIGRSRAAPPPRSSACSVASTSRRSHARRLRGRGRAMASRGPPRPIPGPGSSPTGRFKAIDAMRRRARFDASQLEIAECLETETMRSIPGEAEDIQDDRLRLIVTCCHPVLSLDQVALTLREVCGLTTGEIARAFLPAPLLGLFPSRSDHDTVGVASLHAPRPRLLQGKPRQARVTDGSSAQDVATSMSDGRR